MNHAAAHPQAHLLIYCLLAFLGGIGIYYALKLIAEKLNEPSSMSLRLEAMTEDERRRAEEEAKKPKPRVWTITGDRALEIAVRADKWHALPRGQDNAANFQLWNTVYLALPELREVKSKLKLDLSHATVVRVIEVLD